MAKQIGSFGGQGFQQCPWLLQLSVLQPSHELISDEFQPSLANRKGVIYSVDFLFFFLNIIQPHVTLFIQAIRPLRTLISLAKVSSKIN